VVALEEVGDFALADLRVAVGTSGRGPAESEFSLFGGAVGGTLVGEKKALDSRFGVEALHLVSIKVIINQFKSSHFTSFYR
jgi:hypothetical protein